MKNNTASVTLAGVPVTVLTVLVGPKDDRVRTPIAFVDGTAYRLIPDAGDRLALTHAHDADVLGAPHKVLVAARGSQAAKTVDGHAIPGPLGSVAALEAADGSRLAIRRAPTLDKMAPGGERQDRPVHVSTEQYHKLRDIAAARKWTLMAASTYVMEAGFKALESKLRPVAPGATTSDKRVRA